MGYREVGGGTFLRWEEEGTVIEGIWRGTSHWEKYNSRLGKLEVDKKEVVFSYTKVLAQRLDDVKIGSKVKIKFTGSDKTKDGTAFKTFRVLVDDDGVEGLTDLQTRHGESAPAEGGNFSDQEPPPQTKDEFDQRTGKDDEDVPF